MIDELGIDDLGELAEWGFDFYKEYKLPGAFNPEVFLDGWLNLLKAGVGVVFRHTIKDKANGLIGGIVVPDSFSGEILCQGSFWYVPKDQRNTLAGFRLLSHLEDWARHMGASRIVMSNIHSHTKEKMHNAYSRLGYSPLEVHYWKQL